MTQTQFTKAVALRLGVPKSEVEAFFDAVNAELYTALKKDGIAILRGIGRFTAKKYPARWGRNPATGEKLKIKAKKRVRATIQKSLRDDLM